MNQNTAQNPVLTTNSVTVSPDEIVPVASFDLDPVRGCEQRGSMGPRDTGAADGLTCEDAAEGRSLPSAYIDGVPVAVSVQNLDGQQRYLNETLINLLAGAAGTSLGRSTNAHNLFYNIRYTL